MTGVRVTAIKSRRSNRPVPNQYTITIGDQVHMQSYRSHIATWDRGHRLLTLGPDWDYSITTIKYLHQWLHETLPGAVYECIFDGRKKTIKGQIQAAIDRGYIYLDPLLPAVS